MATKLWRTVRGGSPGSRIVAAYLAVVLIVAMLGPGIAVYASEGDAAPEEAVEAAPESLPEVLPAEEPAPVEEPALVEPEPVPAAAAELSVEPVLTVAAVELVAASTPVLSGDPNPPLTAGGVRIGSPTSGTYTSANVEKIEAPVPADFSITITAWEDSAGWWMSFTSNYPITKVVVKGGAAGANIYTYNPAVYSDTNLHAPANPNGKWAGLSHVDFYFGQIQEPETGDLNVFKFRDDNGDGDYDPTLGEIMLQGWHFTATHETPPLEAVSASAIELVGEGDTDTDGKLSFTDLSPGLLYVTETLKDGWTNTTPLKQSVTIVAGETKELWFGNKPETQEPETGDLNVFKFRDDNGDGDYDPTLGEVMLEDWHFTATHETPPIEAVSASAIELVGEGDTDANGKLSFVDLAPGLLYVTETLQDGWMNTTPLKQSVTIVAGETKELWFGNKPESEEPETGDLIIYKYEDVNENQVHDQGEAMLEDWEFTVVNPAGAIPQALTPSVALIGSGKTNADGELSFTGLTPGMTVRVTETLQDGWENTTPLTQEAVIVAGETTEVWFGNVPVLPFTELDLSITKVADDHTVTEGQLVTYTLTYQNLMSEEDAYNYTIVDDYDERYITIVNANGGVVAGGKITWTFAGPLSKAMGPQTLTYTARVIADMPNAKTNIDNTVVIDDDRDFNPANNRDDERVVYEPVPDDPFLPFTGGEYVLLVLAAVAASVAGLMLRRKPQAS